MALLKIDEELRARLKTAFGALKADGKVANMTEFGEMLGYTSRVSVSQILNGTVPVPRVFVDRLLEAFPCLREQYIVEGVGGIMKPEGVKPFMRDESRPEENIDTLLSIIRDYQAKLESRDRQIDELISMLKKEHV